MYSSPHTIHPPHQIATILEESVITLVGNSWSWQGSGITLVLLESLRCWASAVLCCCLTFLFLCLLFFVFTTVFKSWADQGWPKEGNREATIWLPSCRQSFVQLKTFALHTNGIFVMQGSLQKVPNSHLWANCLSSARKSVIHQLLVPSYRIENALLLYPWAKIVPFDLSVANMPWIQWQQHRHFLGISEVGITDIDIRRRGNLIFSNFWD